jgi:hypothetical protein
MRKHRSSVTGRLCVAVLAVVAVFAAAAHSALAAPSVSITANPALFPAFSPGITDYVVRCTPGTPVQVQVATGGDAQVRVDKSPFRKGRFSSAVSLNTGQEFTLATRGGGGFGGTYHVRCLPTDFPQWNVTQRVNPQAQYYIMAPTFRTGGFSPDGHYAVVMNNFGVPVWWYYDPSGMPGDIKLLSNGHLIWTTLGANIGTGGATAQEHALDGTITQLVNAASFDPYNQSIDFHDIQLLPNGNYLIQGGYNHPADMSNYCYTDTSGQHCGPANATIFDDIIQEVTPNGNLVWQWDTLDNIPLSETGQQWHKQVLNGVQPYDPYHMNSIHEYGDNIVISFRHMDAIYDVSRSTGQVVWKMGGEPRDPSLPGKQLTILNDPACGNHLSGQHYARLLPDGTLTLHDNGSNPQLGCGPNGSALQRPPRAVRYQLDVPNGTATVIETVNDPTGAPKSGCCGSAERLGAGANDDWVMDWGITPTTDELTPSGQVMFQLQWVGRFSYRTDAVLPGQLSITALRNGMNAQFPR